ncbi:PH domain-containing protein [Geosporobacter ferrireducens]|uniref:Uncharacterized protein n=1 Tax=Geosporobacter ferrireducens TaxID=1424294 RepID=A0A1D8GNR1_9FIRM|nr:PH domain-containing protein [Geosporobacter ferrireducens]AOT72515.1 hypothetical protein Gferi_24960 [Geosporobacter ferrireducens]MTI58187.1 hypothetical protein [Geosporobacter ferrireducens]
MDYQMTEKNTGCRPSAIGCGVIVLIMAVIVICLLIWIGGLGESGVRMANEMEDYALEYIEKHDILNGTEEIIAYYDATFTLDGTEAAILTDERVIYHKNGQSTAIALKDVVDVKHRFDKTNGDIIEIVSNNGKIMKIEIDPSDSGESFYNALIAILKNKGITLN